MTIHQWIQRAEKHLLTISIDRDQARLEAKLILGFTLKLPLSTLITKAQSRLTFWQYLKAAYYLHQRKLEKPLAYILGTQPFYGREFIVNKDVLIPRQETEVLIQEVLSLLDSTPNALILDIGTGSGAIACTLKLEHPQSEVVASDVSRRALNVARRNAKTLGAHITFYQGSLLHTDLLEGIKHSKAETIFFCANLPYLPYSDKAKMQQSVIRFEPHPALFANDNGMALIQELILQVHDLRSQSKAHFFAIFEIDPPQSQRLIDFIQQTLPNSKPQIIKDQCERNRFLSFKY